LHAVHEMRPFATDVTRLFVCLSVSVSLCVGHTGELFKNGSAD